MTYKAVAKYLYADEYDIKKLTRGGFETPEEAFEYAKKLAIGMELSKNIYYWVEDEEISPIMEDYFGTIEELLE